MGHTEAIQRLCSVRRVLGELGLRCGIQITQKNFWSRFDNNLIEQRMLELQQYVCFLCHVVAMLHIEWCIMEL